MNSTSGEVHVNRKLYAALCVNLLSVLAIGIIWMYNKCKHYDFQDWFTSPMTILVRLLSNLTSNCTLYLPAVEILW